MKKGLKMAMMSNRRERDGRDENRSERTRDYGRDSFGGELYDYDHYRYKNGRFAPKPRGEYGMPEDAFYDDRGRRHYDNGRYAPMRSEYNGGEYDMMGFDTRSVEERRRDKEYNMMRRPDVSYHYDGYNDEDRRKLEERRKRYEKGYSDADSYDEDDGYSFKVKGKIGRMGGDMKAMAMPQKMTKEMAEEWTRNMDNSDGSHGAHWSFDQVKQIMAQRGIDKDPAEFYAALNMIYSDYCAVAKKYNVGGSIDYYVDMAKAFLDDEDAVPNKLTVYYECIAK